MGKKKYVQVEKWAIQIPSMNEKGAAKRPPPFRN